MSQALWCDMGNHAFSNLEEGFTTMTVQEAVTDRHGNMGQRGMTVHACSVHKVKITSVEPAQAAITDIAPPTVRD